MKLNLKGVGKGLGYILLMCALGILGGLIIVALIYFTPINLIHVVVTMVLGLIVYFILAGSNDWYPFESTEKKVEGIMKAIKEEGNVLTPADQDFIAQALNQYFHQAIEKLKDNTLGDIERRNYEHQRDKAKELINKFIN